jgi:hypothetical protein
MVAVAVVDAARARPQFSVKKNRPKKNRPMSVRIPDVGGHARCPADPTVAAFLATTAARILGDG